MNNMSKCFDFNDLNIFIRLLSFYSNFICNTINEEIFSKIMILQSIDRTPPITGSCTARQAGDKKYFVQWHGFQEDTRIGR